MCNRLVQQVLSTMLVCASGWILLAACPVAAQQIVADGTVEQANGNIDTGIQPGNAGYALYALNGGVIQGVGPLSLVTGGQGAHAVAATSGGFIALLAGSAVRTTGRDATGLVASGYGAAITASNIDVMATNFGSYGMAAEDGATITLGGGRVTSVNSALRVGPGGSILAMGVEATATGGNAIGVLAQGGSIELRGGSVASLQGTSDHGLLASDDGRILADGVDVAATGDGLRSGNGATLEFRNGHVEAAGNGARSASGSAMVLEASSIQAGLAGLAALDAHSTIDARRMTISVQGDAGQGLLATSAARIDTADSVINVSGKQAVGIAAIGVGSRVTALDNTVSSDGDGAPVVQALQGGQVKLAGGSVIATGQAPGLFASLDEARIDAHGVVIQTTGTSAYGAHALLGTIALADTAIVTQGDRAAGVRADNASTLTMRGGSVITGGDSAVAALSIAGSAMTLTDVAIATHGAHGMGASSQRGGRLVLEGGHIDTTGAYATGLYLAGSLPAAGGPAVPTLPIGPDDQANGPDNGTGAVLVANDVAVTTAGQNAHAALIRGNGTLHVSDSTLSASGEDASALLATAYGTGTSVAIVDHGGLNASRAAALRIIGTALHMDVLRASHISGNGTLAEVAADTAGVPGALQLDAVASTLDGAVVTSAGTAHIALRNGSTWNLNAASNLSSVLNDASLIAFATPVSGNFGVLAVGGYTGRNAAMRLNAQLNGDGSPADRLAVYGGTAGGGTALTIVNAGGSGELTVDDGILLVYTLKGGTTQAGAFALAQPVLAGPYEYTLHRGNRAGDLPQNWYLRSDYIPPPPPDPTPPDPPAPPPDPPTPPAPPPPPDPPAPPRPTPPTPPIPHYRPEVSVFAALPALGLHYGRSLLANLHERVGEDQQLHGDSGSSAINGAWVRVLGESGAYEGDGRGVLGEDGPSFDFEMAAVQWGADLYRQEHADGQRDHAGAYLAYGRIKGDVTHFDGERAGKDEVKATSIGAYWTHFGVTGWYVDGVLQANGYEASAISLRRLNLQLDRDVFGWGASLEAGYPLQHGDWLFEPQLQLIYQDIDDQRAADAAAEVRYRNVTSFAARLGARLARSWNLRPAANGSGRQLDGWVRLNAWREFKDGAVTEFSSARGPVPFQGGLSGDWGELGLGMTLQLGLSSSLYAHLGYQYGFSGGYDALDAGAGLRWNW